MKPIAFRYLAVLSILCSLAGVPAPADTETTEPRRPGEQDVCPVCGMVVAPHGDWIAQLIFEDDSVAFFDGAKDLFKYLLARDRFLPDKHDLEITATFVTGYYEIEAVPAAETFYVVGSDIYGPMGPELIPHPTLAEAEEFLRDHGGERIVRFAEVTAELVQSLGTHHGSKTHHQGL